MTDELDRPEDDDGYSLVMPFVVTESHGGPFPDEPWVAGYECGRIDARLAAIAAAEGDGLSATVRSGNVPQLDLIAMRHGFHQAQVLGIPEYDDWVSWSCSRAPEGDANA